jgi:hypothetical protein
MSVEGVIVRYHWEDAKIAEASILIRISERYGYRMPATEFYDAARGI